MKLLIFLTLMIIPISATALEMPAPGEFDKRIKFINYNPHEVVGITGHYGFQTHIQFAAGEKIIKIAGGDLKAWNVGTQDNHLFLRPIGNKPDTNITVLTDHRVYNFQLEGHKSKKGLQHESEEMMFQVAFKYPEEEARHQRYAAEKNALNQRLKSHDPSQPQNFNYWVKGEETLAPNRAYDDRRFTYLTFTNNKDMPAIYIENPDGTESLVNAHVEEDVIVLHKVARKFVLRKGKLVACVYNRSYDPNGIDNKTGTTVPGVTREIKEGA